MVCGIDPAWEGSVCLSVCLTREKAEFLEALLLLPIVYDLHGVLCG